MSARPVRFWFEGLSVEALRTYRELRKYGFQRDDVNTMMAGAIYAQRGSWGRFEVGPRQRRYYSARRVSLSEYPRANPGDE